MNLDLDNFSWIQMAADASRPAPGFMAAIIGGGGKSGLLIHWAQELWANGLPVLLAATTKTFKTYWPQAQTVPADTEAEAMRAAERALAGERLLLAGPGSRPEEKKWTGAPPQWLDNIGHACPQLSILVEADGSQGRDFKFHASHEPVIPIRANLVTAIVGMSLLGHPAGDHIHHLELAPDPVDADQPVTSSQMAYWLTARNGYVARFLYYRKGLLYFNKAETPETRQAAEFIGSLVHRLYPQVTIIAGSLRQKAFYRLYDPDIL